MSAASVDVHADTMKVRQFEADGRMESAQPGLPAGSAAALTGAVAKWQADTTAIFGRMVDHSNGLRTGAAAYQQTDTETASDLDLGL